MSKAKTHRFNCQICVPHCRKAPAAGIAGGLMVMWYQIYQYHTRPSFFTILAAYASLLHPNFPPRKLLRPVIPARMLSFTVQSASRKQLPANQGAIESTQLGRAPHHPPTGYDAIVHTLRVSSSGSRLAGRRKVALLFHQVQHQYRELSDGVFNFEANP